jgi:hypothetical protein
MAIAPGDGISKKEAAAATRAAQLAAAARAAQAANKAPKNNLNDIVKNNPLTKITPAPAAQQVGPMIGNNLGKDAATVLRNDPTLVDRLPEGTTDAAVDFDPTLSTLLGKPVPVVKKDGLTNEQKDAYALLKEIFVDYGLEDLVPVIEGYMKNDVGPNQAKLLLRQEPAYIARFKGNELRVNAGLNALSEDAYLALENDYSSTLSAYGLKDYFGTVTDAASRKNSNAKMAEVIGLNLSPLEFKDRIDTAVVRVKNTDAATKNAFMAFYNVNDNDLVKYFLSGEDGSVLQKKVQAAEISGARYNAGLGQSTLANATDLATLGVDKVAAVAGYRNIAEVLPESEKLSQIYKSMGINYNVTTGEEEFLKKTASSKRARQKLAGREVAEFSGSSGAARGAFSTGYLSKSSTAGLY